MRGGGRLLAAGLGMWVLLAGCDPPAPSADRPTTVEADDVPWTTTTTPGKPDDHVNVQHEVVVLQPGPNPGPNLSTYRTPKAVIPFRTDLTFGVTSVQQVAGTGRVIVVLYNATFERYGEVRVELAAQVDGERRRAVQQRVVPPIVAAGEWSVAFMEFEAPLPASTPLEVNLSSVVVDDEEAGAVPLVTLRSAVMMGRDRPTKVTGLVVNEGSRTIRKPIVDVVCWSDAGDAAVVTRTVAQALPPRNSSRYEVPVADHDCVEHAVLASGVH